MNDHPGGARSGNYPLMKVEGNDKLVGLGNRDGTSFFLVDKEKAERDRRYAAALTNIKLEHAKERLEDQASRLRTLARKIENGGRY